MAVKADLLRKRDRDKLKQFVAESIKCPVARKLEDDALYEFTRHVCTMIQQLYPQDDMQILARYERADELESVRVISVDPDWSTSSWGDSVPLCYQHSSGSTMPIMLVPSRRDIKITHEQSVPYASALAWKHLHEARLKEEEKLRSAFRVLIDSTKTLSELAVAWPEAPKIISTPDAKDPDLQEAESLVQQNLCERGVLSEGCK